MNRNAAMRELERWRQERMGQIGAQQRQQENRRRREQELKERVLAARKETSKSYLRVPAQQRLLAPLNVPAEAINTITYAPITPDDVLINFSKEDPTDRESKYQRFYTEQTMRRMPKNNNGYILHPFTSKPMYNVTRYRPRFPAAAAAAANGPAARRRKSRKNRKTSRRNNRK